MDDPLSKKQLREFERAIIGEFEEQYRRALLSGAFGDDVAGKGDYTVARIALARVPERFRPLSRAGLAAARNYRHF